jgi:uracil DNA glycosylase
MKSNKLKADKVITEQQLEFQWFPPKEDIFKQIQFTPEKPLKALKTG